MRNLWNMKAATFDAAPGSTINTCIQEAIDFSRLNGWHDHAERGTLVSFEFNGVTVSVKSDSDPELVHRDWNRAMSGYIDKNVGPYPMEFSDEEAWQQAVDINTDPYSRGVITFAERWARLMQVEINAGKKLEDIADTTSHEADIDGITGFMYGAAVHILATSWRHGDQLRKWHNKQYGMSEDAEGTANPAIITVGTD